MKEECLICKAPLEYIEKEILMQCSICGKTHSSRARCVNGHFVCDDCHTKGMDKIIAICLESKEKDPSVILEQMMNMPQCHMHGPEHHVMVGCALLAAYKNAGGNIDLPDALCEMHKRGRKVPGGVCGFWGACGAGISAGMFFAIATQSTPLAKESWGLSNQMTARALDTIGKNGGPRCCKRDSYLAVTQAVRFAEEKLGVTMPLGKIRCSRSHMNSHCLNRSCPFYSQHKEN